MAEKPILTYVIKDPVELNLSYMPFITDGGLFVPTETFYPLGTKLTVDLLLPGHKESLKIEAKVVWVTPPNALYQVLCGVGVQLIGTQAPAIRAQIEASLDKSMEIGGYTLGTPTESKK
jgi:type IV pilus assembly protein PilZ